MKCEASHELAVGGFIDPQSERGGLGALLGYFEGEEFIFAGKAGTGFDMWQLVGLHARLGEIEITKGHSSKQWACRVQAHSGSDRRLQSGRVHLVDRSR
jgi:ATP-dependent DNA ligase